MYVRPSGISPQNVVTAGSAPASTTTGEVASHKQLDLKFQPSAGTEHCPRMLIPCPHTTQAPSERHKPFTTYDASSARPQRHGEPRNLPPVTGLRASRRARAITPKGTPPHLRIRRCRTRRLTYRRSARSRGCTLFEKSRNNAPFAVRTPSQQLTRHWHWDWCDQSVGPRTLRVFQNPSACSRRVTERTCRRRRDTTEETQRASLAVIWPARCHRDGSTMRKQRVEASSGAGRALGGEIGRRRVHARMARHEELHRTYRRPFALTVCVKGQTRARSLLRPVVEMSVQSLVGEDGT